MGASLRQGYCAVAPRGGNQLARLPVNANGDIIAVVVRSVDNEPVSLAVDIFDLLQALMPGYSNSLALAEPMSMSAGGRGGRSLFGSTRRTPPGPISMACENDGVAYTAITAAMATTVRLSTSRPSKRY